MDAGHGRITVGDFLDPKPADAEFDTLEEAYREAQARARQSTNTAIAVWEEDELVRVYQRGFSLVPYYG